MEEESKKIKLRSAAALVIANMIGTGVFTSLGFQLLGINSPAALLFLWVAGGIIALCGALVYGELGSAMPRSGGEYHYLTKLFHPSIGFASGFVSSTVGFAAPVALAAMALGKYSSDVFPFLNPMFVGLFVVFAITLLHATKYNEGIGFQDVATAVKVLLIIVFILCGFIFTTPQPISFLPDKDFFPAIYSPAFAVSLVYVSYAYSGWNAAAYIAGEMKDAKRNLPKALLAGTLLVTIMYFLLNFIFLNSAPADDMKGKLDVGYISAEHIFGLSGAKIMGGIITLLLVSNISAMIIAGPRVAQVMGEDSKLLSKLSHKNNQGIPVYAVILQMLISMFLIITSSFEKVLVYMGFALNLFTFLAVLGVFILRYKSKNSDGNYKTFLYPLTPIVFLLASAWTLYFVAMDKPRESLYGLLTVAVGVVIYFVDRRKAKLN